jgi:hypothetical protein
VIRRKAKRARNVKPERNGKSPLRHEKIAATIAGFGQLGPVRPRAARTIALLKQWLSDDSGYDEKSWPRLKESLDRERRRLGARSLLDG